MLYHTTPWLDVQNVVCVTCRTRRIPIVLPLFNYMEDIHKVQ